MKKACTFLCGIAVTLLITGCGSTMPDLTQEETNLISEYAVGVLLKYDKNYGSRLVDTAEYDEAADETEEETPAETEEEPEPETALENETEVVDVSEDEERAPVPATIEEYYGIEDFSFQYTGYDLVQNYPSDTAESEVFFTMDATDGMQLLVVKFMAVNNGASDRTLNMLEHGARFRISVNGETSQGALATMLLNDMQTYHDVVPAGSGVELVSIVEVPQSISVDTIELTLRGGEENAAMILQ